MLQTELVNKFKSKNHIVEIIAIGSMRSRQSELTNSYSSDKSIVLVVRREVSLEQLVIENGIFVKVTIADSEANNYQVITGLNYNEELRTLSVMYS